MVKKIIKLLLGAYLSPLTLFFQRIKTFIRDNFFVEPAQHLYQTVRIIQKEKYNNNEIIIDVGAADGGVSAFFARHFPENLTYSYEPNPAFISMLQQKGNRFPKIQIRNIALSNQQGEMPFYITHNLFSSSLKKINETLLQTQKHPHLALLEMKKKVMVKVNTLDNEFSNYKGNVLLIKLDVQGGELDVLKGGSNLLERTKYILTEMQTHQFYENASPYHEVDKFLREKGFIIVDIIANSRRQGIWMEEFDAIYKNNSAI